jgi:predicted neuraminidase
LDLLVVLVPEKTPGTLKTAHAKPGKAMQGMDQGGAACMGNIGKSSVTCAHQGIVADGAEATALWAHACMANQWSCFQKITSPKSEHCLQRHRKWSTLDHSNSE